MRYRRKSCFNLCSRVKTDGRAVIAGTAIVLAFGLLSRFLSGSPLYMLRLTGISGKIPGVWFFSLVWCLWYAFLGFSFGFVLGSHCPGRAVHKYKGSLWFVLMLVFNLVWYPLFFRAGAIFTSLVDAAIILLFCVLTALEYYKVCKGIGILMFCHGFWLFWCLTINCIAFFSI
ncbi:MAG: tryptophan-rich sensory protein [Clostridia bacterium]|nr:tryptophan-rich sensory protein [Clostridia bacterium]